MNPQFYLQHKIYNFQNVMNQLVEGDKTVYEQAPQSVIIIDTEEPEYLDMKYLDDAIDQNVTTDEFCVTETADTACDATSSQSSSGATPSQSSSGTKRQNSQRKRPDRLKTKHVHAHENFTTIAEKHAKAMEKLAEAATIQAQTLSGLTEVIKLQAKCNRRIANTFEKLQENLQ